MVELWGYFEDGLGYVFDDGLGFGLFVGEEVEEEFCGVGYEGFYVDGGYVDFDWFGSVVEGVDRVGEFGWWVYDVGRDCWGLRGYSEFFKLGALPGPCWVVPVAERALRVGFGALIGCMFVGTGGANGFFVALGGAVRKYEALWALDRCGWWQPKMLRPEFKRVSMVWEITRTSGVSLLVFLETILQILWIFRSTEVAWLTMSISSMLMSTSRTTMEKYGDFLRFCWGLFLGFMGPMVTLASEHAL
ncbi:hypothetical protein Zmor_014900 [Zophobas morio]|uniref:Uncharacterized protein n=1 Tax=Zophobas morio TaxID=2755281 RepID=A0AA38IFL1_9CUCU|nr:hypothetical protein Zmor_014900 [Zophobas morio]